MKDWKKQKSYRNQYSWKKENGDMLVMFRDTSTNPYWHFFLLSGLFKITKTFRKKEDALTYAKSYMKIH